MPVAAIYTIVAISKDIVPVGSTDSYYYFHTTESRGTRSDTLHTTPTKEVFYGSSHIDPFSGYNAALVVYTVARTSLSPWHKCNIRSPIPLVPSSSDSAAAAHTSLQLPQTVAGKMYGNRTSSGALAILVFAPYYHNNLQVGHG